MGCYFGGFFGFQREIDLFELSAETKYRGVDFFFLLSG